MEEIEILLQSYGVFLLVFSAGCAYGYAIANSMRVTEIALDLWRDGARDCIPFLTPPWNGPLKIICFLLAFILIYNEAASQGSETWLYGVTSFLIGFAAMYGWIGDRSKTEFWLPGMHSRMMLRSGQLKNMGEINKSEALKTLTHKFVKRYPRYQTSNENDSMPGPFNG